VPKNIYNGHHLFHGKKLTQRQALHSLTKKSPNFIDILQGAPSVNQAKEQ
jgi:hypothetical protein